MTPLPLDFSFEGVEKRIELTFAVPPHIEKGMRGLNRNTWDEVCSLCKCTILHHEPTPAFDSYILSESSLFVYKGKVMIKTCGTTVPLEGVSYLVKVAREHGITPIDMTYSRSSFIFPADQVYPYNDLGSELEYLSQMKLLPEDELGPLGKSCILGDAEGKYWLVHRKEFVNETDSSSTDTSSVSASTPDNRRYGDNLQRTTSDLPNYSNRVTVDIVMTGIGRNIAQRYYRNNELSSAANDRYMSSTVAEPFYDFKSIVGKSFDPCGYSCNAHNAQDDEKGERYMTIHITPEEAFSYASVEVVFLADTDHLIRENIRDPLAAFHIKKDKIDVSQKLLKSMNDFITRAISYFQPRDALVTVLACGEDISARDLPPHICVTKINYMQHANPITSGNLLGEDIVASSVFYSAVSSGTIGCKPTGLS